MVTRSKSGQCMRRLHACAAATPRSRTGLAIEVQRKLILVPRCRSRRVDTDEVVTTRTARDVVPRRPQELVRAAVDTAGAHRAIATSTVRLVRARAPQERML